MPQALLLVGPTYVGVGLFARRLVAILLCQTEDKPCGRCDSCHLLQVGNHPDFQLICPEVVGGVIKIDRVRALQDEVYQTPKCGQKQIILIENADKMNISSANALLKILEEPPPYVHFILVAEQLSTIPETVLSRCQRMVFPDRGHEFSNYFGLAEQYPADSSRAKLYKKCQEMIIALCEIAEGTMSPCMVAAQWADYELADLIWLLYLISAQAIQLQLVNVNAHFSENDAMMRFVRLLNPIILFNQFTVIHSILKKMSHNIPINATLAIENILIGYVI